MLINPLFIRSSKFNLRVAGYFFAAALLLLINFVPPLGYYARQSLLTIISPFMRVIQWPMFFYEDVKLALKSNEQLTHKVRILEDQVSTLAAENHLLKALKKENSTLKDLLHYHKSEFGYQLAKSIAPPFNPFRQMLILDKGLDANLHKGQAVFTGVGLVGQLNEVTPHFSRVLLITDSASAVPVSIVRTGEQAVIKGLNQPDRVLLTHLVKGSDINIGDVVQTSGLAGRYPEGIHVGKVIKLLPATDEGLLDAEIDISANPSKLRRLLIATQSDEDRKLVNSLEYLKLIKNSSSKNR